MFGAIGERGFVDHSENVFQVAMGVGSGGHDYAEFRGCYAAAAGLVDFKVSAGFEASLALRSGLRRGLRRLAMRRRSCRR